MKRFTVRLLIAGALFGVLSFSLQLFDPLPWTGFLTSHAQERQTQKFFVFDGHSHPTSTAYRRGSNIGDPNSSPQFSLSMARQGGLGASFFNTSIDEFYEANHIAVKELLRQFDHFYRQLALYPDQVGVATSGDEVRALQKQGKLAAIPAIEGAIAIESDLGVLRMMYRLGLREMNLVHNLENNIGDVQYTTKNNGRGSGLTGYGRELVAEMNRLGIVIDMSHMAEQTAWDVMKVSTQPVVTTHSGVRALVKRPGTWSDEMIQELAQKGGVICIPFLLPQLISQEYHNKWHAGRPPRGSGLMGWEPLVYRGDPTKIYDFIAERTGDPQAGQSERTRQRQLDRPPLSNLIDAIDHVVRLVGADTVGISSDAGGDRVNVQGIENVGEYQNIAQALLKRGYSEGDVAKIMGENLLRIFDQVTR
ncbi:MAG: dipeptidase [Acidobacteria bacterium]|nr:dipeptidase [Acidobacteriota bacterium]